MREVYLDNNATTAIAPEVREAMEPYLSGCYGNPSSVHRKGREAAAALDEAREAVCVATGLADHDVVFTSGGTEANNLAVEGVWRARPGSRRHYVTTTVEHASVLQSFTRLQEEGAEVTRVAVDGCCRVGADELWHALRPDTVLLSIIHVNNEVGTIHDVEALAAQAKERVPRLIVHVDGVQALGKIAVCAKSVDLYSGSAHKLHGPKGIGFLAARRQLALAPLLRGGGHEGGLRSGTQNVAGAVGLGRAVSLAEERRAESEHRLSGLRERLRRGLVELGGRLHSPPDGVPHTTNVSFPGVPGEVMLRALEDRGVFVSTASACTTRKHARSHVLHAMGLPPEVAGCAIRISLSRYTTEDEVARGLEAMRDAVATLTELAAPRRRARGVEAR